MRARVLGCARLSATPWAVAGQAPLSTGFSRQEHWSGPPFPPPGGLPDPGLKPTSLASPAVAGRRFTTGATWEAGLPRSPLHPGRHRPPHCAPFLGWQGAGAAVCSLSERLPSLGNMQSLPPQGFPSHAGRHSAVWMDRDLSIHLLEDVLLPSVGIRYEQRCAAFMGT